MKIATVLDLRYKLKFMNVFYSIVYGEEISITENEVCRVIRSLLYKLVLEYQGSIEGMATSDSLGAAHRNVVNNEGDILSLTYLTNSYQRNQNIVQLICTLSWTYILRSQHCLELKNLTSFIGGNMQG
jgi:hypothetical protein